MILKKHIINLKNKNVKCRSNEVSLKVNIGKNCRIDKNVKISSNVTIGDNTYINYQTTIDANTQIGKFCSIGPQVYIAPGNHPMRYASTHPFVYDEKWSKLFSCKPIKMNIDQKLTVIGNDVWIGTRAIIVSGVKVNNGAIIGAGAVVTKEVPPYAIVAGVPAKVIGYRFNEKVIKDLNNTNWWDWKVDKIAKNHNKFSNVLEIIGVNDEN